MIRALLAFARFELELFFQAFIAVFFTFVAPSAIFIMALNSAKGDRGAAAADVFPAVLGLIIVFAGFYTLACQIVSYREAGFYKRILVTKIDPIGIALSNAIRGYAVVFIGFAILLLECLVIFRVVPRIDLLQASIAVLVAGAGLFLLALIPACFIKRSPSMFTAASVFSYILMFTAGVRPDLGKWSSAADTISSFSPSFHAFKILRAGFHGRLLDPHLLTNAVVLVICMILSLAVVRRKLSWM